MCLVVANYTPHPNTEVMMKKLLMVTLLFVSTISVAQYNPLVRNDWELLELVINNETVEVPASLGTLELFLFDIDVVLFNTYVCNNFESSPDYDFNNQQFTLPSIDISTTNNCDDPDNQTFEETYFNFYVSNGDAPFSYEITLDDADYYSMVFTNAAGDQAIYGGERILSVHKFESFSVQVYPNPASEMLFITSEGTQITTLAIYTINGQQVASEENPSHLLDVSTLSEGLYFLELTSETGNKTVQKFIKN